MQQSVGAVLSGGEEGIVSYIESFAQNPLTFFLSFLSSSPHLNQFVIAVISSFQLVASVSSAVKGDAPPALEAVNIFFGAFRFEAPLVHPDCVVNVKVGLGSEYAVLIFGLLWTALDLSLTIRWVRIEQLIFGWTCYKRPLEQVYRAVKTGRRIFREFITPVARWFISLTASMTYIAVVKTAVDMLTCRRSQALGGAWALGKNPTVRCFDVVHTPCFILALLAIFTVGVVWPLAWFVVLCHHFAIRTPLVKCGWSLCMKVCVKVEGERNRFEDDDDEEDDEENDDEEEEDDDDEDDDDEAEEERLCWGIFFSVMGVCLPFGWFVFLDARLRLVSLRLVSLVILCTFKVYRASPLLEASSVC